MGHQKQEAAPSAPHHLSSWLKQDTDRLQGPEHAEPRDLPPDIKQSSEKPKNEPDGFIRNGLSPDPLGYETSGLVSNASRVNQASAVKPWQRFDAQSGKGDLKPIHKRVTAPSPRATLAKSATLPSKTKINLTEDNSKPQNHIVYQQSSTSQVSCLLLPFQFFLLGRSLLDT